MAADLSILRHHLEPLHASLQDPAVREVVVNRPGEFGVETARGWTWVEDDRLTPSWLIALARAAAAFTGQDVSAAHPLCSTSLPGGARCQIVLPPTAEHVSLTIRRPMGQAMGLEGWSCAGLARPAGAQPSTPERLATNQDWPAFFSQAVRQRQTILVSGATGSGKTSFARSLAALIAPSERLVTIEDARELDPPHRNLVRLAWARGGNGRASLGPGELLEAALRMRPDRILLGEVRDGASAFHLLRNVASGHPGSIATIHAGSAELALDQLCLLVKETPAGRDLPRADIRALFEKLIDIVVQLERLDGAFHIAEVRHANPVSNSRAA